MAIDFTDPIFVGQTVDISLDAIESLSGTVSIKYLRPDNVAGSWNGSINGSDDSVIDVTTIFTHAGIWKIWAHEDNGGVLGIGQVRTVKVLKQGQIN